MKITRDEVIKNGRANASRAGLDAALRWIDECRKLGWLESQLDDLEALWWKHHDKDVNLNPPNVESLATAYLRREPR